MSVLFWIAEHWWILAIVAGLAVAAAMFSGFLSAAALLKALAELAAAVVEFFAQPAEQIASKILYGIACAVVGVSVGYYHGTFKERAIWKAREAEHAAAMEKLRTDSAAEADRKVAEAAATEQKKTAAAEMRIKDYEAKIATAPAGDCRIDDDDLRAAGDVQRANGVNIRRNTRRVQ